MQWFLTWMNSTISKIRIISIFCVIYLFEPQTTEYSVSGSVKPAPDPDWSSLSSPNVATDVDTSLWIVLECAYQKMAAVSKEAEDTTSPGDDRAV